MAIIDVDPAKVLSTTSDILNAYKQIDNDTATLKGDLRKFGSSLDPESANSISVRINQIVALIDSNKENLKVICDRMVNYAEKVEEARKNDGVNS